MCYDTRPPLSSEAHKHLHSWHSRISANRVASSSHFYDVPKLARALYHQSRRNIVIDEYRSQGKLSSDFVFTDADKQRSLRSAKVIVVDHRPSRALSHPNRNITIDSKCTTGLHQKKTESGIALFAFKKFRFCASAVRTRYSPPH